MMSHCKAIEQFCSVMQKNIILEETAFYDGSKECECVMFPQCRYCKNSILKKRIKNKSSIDTDEK